MKDHFRCGSCTACFKDEIINIPKKKEEDEGLDKCEVIKYFKEDYFTYAIFKMKEEQTIN